MSLKSLLKPVSYSNKPTYDDLMNAESALGRTIFGPIPAGHQREFFKTKNNKWLWHESWFDETNNRKEVTILYEVRPSGVFKKPLGGNYQKLDGVELENFRNALHLYLNLVKTNLYC